MAASAHSYPSDRATHGSSVGKPRALSPVSGPTGAGRCDHTAVRDMRTHGNAQLPADRDDLAREIEIMWNEGEKLEPQLPKKS
ncbi:hypothetical protein FIE12Z_12392 [Fusarium flagelliforme]|uniref:Uncharacterized protein n=1 Tax=Fusarium flagelliforme TaxID=2675880 RepID=A0A395M646_9HYPO|nr:hypothetical protein FIE12Z_12392 [Fusarium flagelliforme]